MTNKIDLGYVTIEYKEPIIYRRYTRPVVLDAKEIVECIEAGEKLATQKPYLVLTDARIQADVTPDGRKAALVMQDDIHVIAQAILARWLGQKMIVNVISELNKPPYPLQVFDDEAEAVKWLMEEKAKWEEKGIRN